MLQKESLPTNKMPFFEVRILIARDFVFQVNFLTSGRGCDLGVEVELVDVDALVPGEGSVPRPRLQPDPALVLELAPLHVLTQLGGPLC